MAGSQRMKHCLVVGEFYRRLSLNLNRCPVNGCSHWSSILFTTQQQQQQQQRQHSFLTSVFDVCSTVRDTVHREAYTSVTSAVSTATVIEPNKMGATSSIASSTVPFYRLQQYCSFTTGSSSASNRPDGAGRSGTGDDSRQPPKPQARHPSDADEGYCWRCDAPVNGPKIFPADPILGDADNNTIESGVGGGSFEGNSGVNTDGNERPKSGNSESITASNDKKTNTLECAHCGALLPLGAGRDHFTLFSLPAVYELDLAELKRRYLKLQQTMHPDRNVNRDQTETGHALDNSSIINTAYKTLRDPYQRALYLLKLLYSIGIDEDATDTEPDMLLEIMELNEDIELASDGDSMLDMISKIENDLTAILEGIKQAFTDKNGGAVRRLVIRYSYYHSALDKLKQHLNQHQANQ